MAQERYIPEEINDELESEPVYGPAITPEVIKDLQDIHAETDWQEGDLEEVCIRVPEHKFHQAVAIAVLFDELSRFQEKGFFISKRALRVLQNECSIPVEILRGTAHSSQESQTLYEQDADTENDLLQERVAAPVIPFPRSEQIYNERAHMRARTATDLW